MMVFSQNLTSRLVIVLIMLSILLSILFFYFSNEVMEAQNRLNTQALNMTLFLSQYNIIMTISEPLPASFLRASYENYSLAAYGIMPDINELNAIETKFDYFQKFEGTQGSIVDNVNVAMNSLKKDKNIQTKLYHTTFIILIITQFSLVLISIKWGADKKYIIFILLIFSILLLSITLGLEWVKKFWYHIISSITAVLMLTLFYTQYQHNKTIDRFVTLPSVGFSLMSGETFFKKQNKKKIKNEDKKDTYFIVDNKSRFPISFWVVIYNERKNEKLFESSYWRINPGTIFFPHQPDLKERVLKGGSNKTYVEISYAPLHNKGLKQTLPLEEWTFRKDSNEWEDCHQMRDSNNKSYDKVLEEMGKP